MSILRRRARFGLGLAAVVTAALLAWGGGGLTVVQAAPSSVIASNHQSDTRPQPRQPREQAEARQSREQTETRQSAAEESEGECDAGAFTWLVCPLINQLAKQIESLTHGALAPLLQVSPLSQANTPEIYRAWEGVRSLANLAFIFVFLFIAFANTASWQIDSYTVKRMLPRLVAATILVQISFFICAFIVDGGNVLGGGIRELIFGFSQPAQAQTTNLLINVPLMTAGLVALGAFVWGLSIPILLGLLIGVLAVFLTLGARLLLLAILIVASPLAFVAWVLPGTEGYFKRWWSAFTKLVLMYPIVVAILAIASRIGQLAPAGETANNGFAGLFVDILTPIVTIMAFAAIPLAFKWAGGLMTAMAGAMAAYSAKGGGWARDRQWIKDLEERNSSRKRVRMQQLRDLADSRTTRLGRAGSRAGLAAFGLASNSPTTSLALQRDYAGRVHRYEEELEDMQEAGVPNIMTAITAAYATDPAERSQALNALQQNAPALLSYIKTPEGRMALLKRLDEPNLINSGHLKSVLESDPKEYGLALQVASKTFSKKPAVLARFFEGQVDRDGNVRQAGELNREALAGLAKTWSADKIRDDIHQENFNLAQKDRAVAEVFSESITGAAYGGVFERGRRSFADPGKRTEIIKMMIANKDLFASGNGALAKKEVLDQLEKNADIARTVAEGLNKLRDIEDDPATRARVRAVVAHDLNPDADTDQLLEEIRRLLQ